MVKAEIRKANIVSTHSFKRSKSKVLFLPRELRQTQWAAVRTKFLLISVPIHSGMELFPEREVDLIRM